MIDNSLPPPLEELDNKKNVPSRGDGIVTNATDSTVKQDLTITIVPVIAVCIVFVVVGVVAIVFRKKICPSRIKSKKANMVSLIMAHCQLELRLFD